MSWDGFKCLKSRFPATLFDSTHPGSDSAVGSEALMKVWQRTTKQRRRSRRGGWETRPHPSCCWKRDARTKPREMGAGGQSRPCEAGAAHPIPFLLGRQNPYCAACAFSLIPAVLPADVFPHHPPYPFACTMGSATFVIACLPRLPPAPGCSTSNSLSRKSHLSYSFKILIFKILASSGQLLQPPSFWQLETDS